MAGEGTSANDCHEVAISIRRSFEEVSLPSECCIFTVPKRLRQSNVQAYTPRAIAIGPYHRDESSLKGMEDHKLLYLQNLLQHDDRLQEYIKCVKSCENDARRCYDEHIELDSNKFAEMMLLDSIFMIQIFIMHKYPRRRLSHDRIFGKPWMLKDVRRDMVLLENQIPFFVIQRLFDIACRTENWYEPEKLRELMYKFFSPFTQTEELPAAAARPTSRQEQPQAPPVVRRQEPRPRPQEPRPAEPRSLHILDALCLLFLPPMDEAPRGGKGDIKSSLSATELVAAGVRLTKGKSKRLYDIKFKNGELKIPCLVLYDRTESFFRNMIAFEQCYYRSHVNLISYLAFMDQLVDTPADTKLLIDKGIIENWLSDKEAATDLINSFCNETSMSPDQYRFLNLSNELIKHCQRPSNRWNATLKREYCNNPRVVISVIAAMVLLLLTVLQTVCSVLSVKF